jgi:hypothetical protein
LPRLAENALESLVHGVKLPQQGDDDDECRTKVHVCPFLLPLLEELFQALPEKQVKNYGPRIVGNAHSSSISLVQGDRNTTIQG